MISPQPGVNVKVRILPFGKSIIELKGIEEPKPQAPEPTPLYGQPATSGTKMVQITFGQGDYFVPKTTGGFF